MKKKKIPKKAVEPLMETCEYLSKELEKPAPTIFKGFLELMNKYADYFFSQPWPKKYDYDEATTFTDEDVDFVFGCEEEFSDRYTTVCLKKNMYLEHGFMGYFGMFWTRQAFHEKFVRCLYEPVLEIFRSLAREKDGRLVLDKLRVDFSAMLIHKSLVDLLEHEYPDKSVSRLIDELFVLLHEDEALPTCGYHRCEWYRRQKHQSSTS